METAPVCDDAHLGYDDAHLGYHNAHLGYHNAHLGYGDAHSFKNAGKRPRKSAKSVFNLRNLR